MQPYTCILAAKFNNLKLYKKKKKEKMCRNRVMKDMKEYLPLKFHEQQAAMLLCSFEILEKYLLKRRTHNYHHVQMFH